MFRPLNNQEEKFLWYLRFVKVIVFLPALLLYTSQKNFSVKTVFKEIVLLKARAGKN
jgi:hypothetical protein